MTQENSFDLIVIGSGPAGYVAAIRGAQLGMKVACIDKRKTLGGTCLNVGCIPSKALLESSELYSAAKNNFKDHGILAKEVSLDFSQFMDRKNKVVRQLTMGVAGLFKKNKITSIVGLAKIINNSPRPPLNLRGGESPEGARGSYLKVEVSGDDGKKILSAKNILIATGSVPAQLQNLPFDGKKIIDSTTALSLTEIPKRMVVIGGGYIGLEMGSVYNRLGSEVTIIEALDRIVSGMDYELGETLLKILKKQGFKFQLSHKVLGAMLQAKEVEVSIENSAGEKSVLPTDVVLVAVGRKPCVEGLGLKEAGISLDEKGRIKVDKNFVTSVPGIYAVGDVIAGPMLAHKASQEGVAVAEIMAGQKSEVNYQTIPGVVYTSPEVASVGLTEEELKKKGVAYKTFKFPFMANGRSLAMGNKEGFVKLISSSETNQILGAHLIGPHVSELIAEIVLAMEFGSTADDIALTIHAHPTLSEATREAALGLSTGVIHF